MQNRLANLPHMFHNLPGGKKSHHLYKKILAIFPPPFRIREVPMIVPWHLNSRILDKKYTPYVVNW